MVGADKMVQCVCVCVNWNIQHKTNFKDKIVHCYSYDNKTHNIKTLHKQKKKHQINLCLGLKRNTPF